MIVIGYQGIGKSTLAKNKKYRVVDLESSNFFVNGEKDENWYIVYCQIAKHLSDQGYTVFVSSHKEVRDELLKYKESTKIYICAPAPKLKPDWVIKLQKRYNQTGLDKDKKAYLNAFTSYLTNIEDILKSDFEIILIESLDYDLSKIIPGLD